MQPIHPISYPLTLWRGLKGRCPHCGEGKVFANFLKVAPSCAACGEDLHYHRADDLPAYLVILLLGHIMVPLVLTVETMFHPAYQWQLIMWLPTTLLLAVGLLQPVKGAVVGLQWRMGLHGFSAAKQRMLEKGAGK